MTLQYIRQCKLSVGGIDNLAELQVQFQIRDKTTQSPKIGVIRIINLSEQTAQALPKAGGYLELSAGYNGNCGVILAGDVKEKLIGRVSPTDTYCDLYVVDGGRAYQNATAQKTLKAGSTGRDIVDACLTAMRPFGIKAGYIASSITQMKYPRAQTLFGMARDYMRTAAQSNDCTWNILDGKLNVVEKDKGIGGPVVLNAATGLIGRPVQTTQGIIARCLINPAIKVNGLVQIDQRSIDGLAPDLSYAGAPNNAEPNRGSIAADGIYKVHAIDCTGETRGQPWYFDLICNANGAGVTTGQARLGRT